MSAFKSFSIHLIRSSVFTFPEPVDKSMPNLPNVTRLVDQGRQGCLPFQAEDTGCASSCITYFYWPEIRQLCQGIKGVRPPRYDVNTKCHLLSMEDPYLRVGPFLLENKNTEGNYVAQIHDMISPTEMAAIKEKTQTRLKATPYAAGNKLLDFSYDRTSKVHYLSERTDNLTQRLSKRLGLAMAYNIYLDDRPYTSENFQIMNYGIGGKIGLHLDTSNAAQENGIGGGRFTTAMLYLSTVEAGGRTIFPKLMLSVKPEAGSLLYWHLR